MSVLNPTLAENSSQSPLDTLQSMLWGEMAAVNALILTHMHSPVALIPQLARYLIASGGKRIRPLMTLASTSLFNGDMTRAHRLATAVEFIHSATLLHDDVVDDSEERRGQKSANVIFGNEASVLVGDFLFSKAFQNNLTTTMDQYLDVVKGKTAALFAASCEVGPLIAGQSETIVKALSDYGLFLGIAFQITDDVLDYAADPQKLGKAIGDDFREGKITAPIIYALEKATNEEKTFWHRTLGDKQQDESDLIRAISLLERHKAMDSSLSLARLYSARANDALSNIPPSSMKDTLQALALYAATRDH
jgi:octaprenyl-diphosphate synthase